MYRNAHCKALRGGAEPDRHDVKRDGILRLTGKHSCRHYLKITDAGVFLCRCDMERVLRHFISDKVLLSRIPLSAVVNVLCSLSVEIFGIDKLAVIVACADRG